MNRFVALIAVVSALALVGCNANDPANVKTDKLYASFAVEGNNQNIANCVATFQMDTSAGKFVNLRKDESLTCNGNPMVRFVNGEIVSYKATVASVPGGQYKIVFTRPGEDQYVSVVELPSQISGMNPGAAFAVPKGTILNPSWHASSSTLDEMNVEVAFRFSDGVTEKSVAPASQRDPSPERGTVGFGAGDTSMETRPPGTWPGTLTYTRSRYGEVAAGLNGLLTASQKAVVPMQLTD